MVDLEQIGEFGLIERIKTSFDDAEPSFRDNLDGVRGIGDDCAVIPQREGYDTLVSTDMLIEGTHFLMDRVPPFQLGWKSAAVNISDIAAMGGRPTATFLSLAIPQPTGSTPAYPHRNPDRNWIDGFIDGYRTLSAKFGVPLLGGDTTASPDRLCINVTVLGAIKSGAAVLRSQAQTGDLICVTGTLGDSAAGLKAILERMPEDEITAELIRRHYEPVPRVNEGAALAATEGVHAMMDISDGIGSDLRHILSASSVGAEVDTVSVPMSEELKRFCSMHKLDPLDSAISGGEDYELLFTASPEAERTMHTPHTVIGRITEGPAGNIRWIGTDRDFMGYKHF